MYANVRSCVHVGDRYSDELDVKVGFLQGSVLSPLLFIIVLEALSHQFHSGVPWDDLYADEDCVCCASAWDEAKLGILDRHQLSDEAVHKSLQNFHNLLCQLETAVVAPFQCIPFTFVEADIETLRGHGSWRRCVTSCSYHLHHYA